MTNEVDSTNITVIESVGAVLLLAGGIVAARYIWLRWFSAPLSPPIDVQPQVDTVLIGKASLRVVIHDYGLFSNPLWQLRERSQQLTDTQSAINRQLTEVENKSRQVHQAVEEYSANVDAVTTPHLNYFNSPFANEALQPHTKDVTLTTQLNITIT